LIAWDALRDRVNGDAEFRLAARHWDATLRLDLGEASHRLRFRDGSLAEVEPCPAEAPCDLFVGASEDDWRELLAHPERFLSCLLPVLEKIRAAGSTA
jgi:hypothetical protein